MNNVIKKMCQSVKKLAHFLFVNIKFILMLIALRIIKKPRYGSIINTFNPLNTVKQKGIKQKHIKLIILKNNCNFMQKRNYFL